MVRYYHGLHNNITFIKEINDILGLIQIEKSYFVTVSHL